MAYVIYNTKTLRRFESRQTNGFFELERTAKATKTRNKLGEDWKVATVSEYDAADVMVEVKNLQSGKPALIRKSEVGTCCDPSTERYWQM